MPRTQSRMTAAITLLPVSQLALISVAASWWMEP